MKTTKAVVAAAVVLLGACSGRVSAIENLQISVQCRNVVLSWPSVEGETYIVRYRPDLGLSSSWTVLTNYFPAANGTNMTFFVHSNIVQYPNCGGAGGFAMMAETADSSTMTAAPKPTGPMVLRADGTGNAVPLVLYPIGFDLSEFMIWDPATGKYVNGADYPRTSFNFLSAGGSPPTPQGSGGIDSPDPNPAIETGFYEVVRNGVHLFGLTNGTVLSGFVQIPVEIATVSTDQIAGLTFTADGSPLIGATGNGGAPWMLQWDTSMVTNGTYNITAQVNFNTDDSMTNTPVSVTVNNTVSFPNYFTRIFGNQMWIYAQSTIFPADFRIDMYTDETNFLGSFSGSTSDGIISFLWDLTDGNGYTYTNESFSGVFNVTPSGAHPNGASSASPTNGWGKEPYWPGLGGFTVAYSAADNNVTKTYRIGQMMIGGEGGIWGGVVSTLSYQGLGVYVLSPGNIYGSAAFQMSDAASRADLLSYLANRNSWNFYYFGHGSPASFGGGTTSIPTVTAADLRGTLLNVMVGKEAVNRHPYRLVVIDGCDAGKGTLCEEFGIPAQTLNNAFFVSGTGVRSRAFVGFKGAVTFDEAQWTARSTMLNGFFTDWLQQRSISVCVSNAQNGVYTMLSKMPSSAVIYGAKDLQIYTPDPP